MLSNDFKYMFDVLMKIRNDLKMCWSIHTTVNLALIGWIVSKHGDVVSMPTKYGAAAGYSAFFLVIIYTFWLNYRDHERVVKDIKAILSSEEIKSIPQKGFIHNSLNFHYIKSQFISYTICFGSYLIIICLIFFFLKDRVISI